MALWTMIRCDRCGFSGCGAPIGDRCPRCNQPIEMDPPPPRHDPEPEVPEG